VRAIRAQRDQLSSQLSSAADRRAQLGQELARTGVDALRPGLEARIQLLDKRILQLETDLATTGQQLSLASGELVTSTEVANQGGGDDFEEGLMVGGFSVFAFIAVAFALMRRRWRRRMGKRPAPLGDDASQRLERLENGMDAIAIEIERVSEGQRFVTKLLSESHAAAVPQKIAAQPALQRSDPAER
jgi:hypothetical protein